MEIYKQYSLDNHYLKNKVVRSRVKDLDDEQDDSTYKSGNENES